jgi:hypothetical protein
LSNYVYRFYTKARIGHNIRRRDQGHFSRKWTVLEIQYHLMNTFGQQTFQLWQSKYRTNANALSANLPRCRCLYDHGLTGYKIKNKPNLTQFDQYVQSEPYGRLRVANFKKDIVEIHEDVTHRQIERSFSSKIPTRCHTSWIFCSPDATLKQKWK